MLGKLALRQISGKVRYLTHPQVLIEPDKPVPSWSLSDTGRARVQALAANLGVIADTTRIISSDETKALETAGPLAVALNLSVEIRPSMHENDRSATGFLPPPEFEMVADQFFANPQTSIRGWETAFSAQQRIVSEVQTILEGHTAGDILFVGHGGVGTLLYCALAGVAIDRKYDQGPGGGGCWFEFGLNDLTPAGGWMPMERLRG
jgi:broad specificity phosphatase PhoE